MSKVDEQLNELNKELLKLHSQHKKIAEKFLDEIYDIVLQLKKSPDKPVALIIQPKGEYYTLSARKRKTPTRKSKLSREDAGMIKAMDEGMKSGFVSEEEVIKALKL